MTANSMFDQVLGQNHADFALLTPLTFQERADHVARVERKPGATVSEDKPRRFRRQHMAGPKVRRPPETSDPEIRAA